MRRGQVLIVASSALALGLFAPAGAGASCTGGELRSPHELRPGQSASVSGRWFHEGCDDTGTAGCSSPPPSSEFPSRDVALSLEQGGRSWSLGEADAGNRSTQYAVSWRFVLPGEVEPGSARLVAGYSELPVRIRR